MIHDDIGDVFVKNFLITKAINIKLKGLKFHTVFVRNIANIYRGKVRKSASWAQASELWARKFYCVATYERPIFKPLQPIFGYCPLSIKAFVVHLNSLLGVDARQNLSYFGIDLLLLKGIAAFRQLEFPNLMRFMKTVGFCTTFFLSILTTSVALTSCTSTDERVACQETDWYEIGRRQGAKGLPLQETEAHKPRCAETDKELVQALFRNGHHKGLLEFCSPDNAFEYGKGGHNYRSVCPPEIETHFVKRFQAGRKFFEIEQDNKRLDERIESIFRLLNRNNVDPNTRGNLSSQLSTLQRLRVQNERRLSELEKSQIN